MIEPQIVKWEAPPKRLRAVGRVDWCPVAEELKARPKVWALLHVVRGKVDSEDRRLKGLSNSIRRGLIRAFEPDGSFEATSRMVDDETRLYARYVGG